ncbi:MAG: hypothetical protein A3H96_26230 [Acidobacteria bacterium RIFCSPLOWO2_02_FULL_67_36]|nr:MAG: hypothetical protein A3H96_26230 [Acidobacteria bacterium RIFCSPLOWO2_02_FULL_67_36]OFW21778.1 MAG: hypothetical protein A3G21_09340 [Acidobacteria bacterium RIFCSPLOWO2_12_FULL_66_21]
MAREPPVDGGDTPGPWHEIVGVVKDVTVMSRKGSGDAVLYRPAGTGAASPMRLLIRTQGAASPTAHRLQAALSANPDVLLPDHVMSLDRFADDEALPTRVFLRVLAVVATVALLLSTAGIHALVSFTLARRTREIAIRVALGAVPRRIISSVFSRAFAQIGIGLLAGAGPGIAIAVAAVGVGMAPGVGVTLAVCAFVMLVAMISCALPLRRAMRIEPTQALRADA